MSDAVGQHAYVDRREMPDHFRDIAVSLGGYATRTGRLPLNSEYNWRMITRETEESQAERFREISENLLSPRASIQLRGPAPQPDGQASRPVGLTQPASRFSERWRAGLTQSSAGGGACDRAARYGPAEMDPDVYHFFEEVCDGDRPHFGWGIARYGAHPRLDLGAPVGTPESNALVAEVVENLPIDLRTLGAGEGLVRGLPRSRRARRSPPEPLLSRVPRPSRRVKRSESWR